VNDFLISISNIKYHDILEVFDFQVKHNTITCLVGESGGGKTTLLKLINKMINPTEGIILYENENISEIETLEYRKNVGLLTQKPFLYPETIFDNFKKVAFFNNLLLDEILIKGLLESVSLNKPLDFPVSKLSGGEAQRLALVRLIYKNPKLILLDEPSSSLDQQTENTIIEYVVKYIKENNKTLIIVTHSDNIAQKYSDFTYRIKEGKLKGRDNFV